VRPPAGKLHEIRQGVSVRVQAQALHAVTGKDRFEQRATALGRCSEVRAKAPALGIDVDLLTGFGILEVDGADVRHLFLAWISQPHSRYLVPLPKALEGRLPRGICEEVRDDEDQ
jgi:hypothetical protein